MTSYLNMTPFLLALSSILAYFTVWQPIQQAKRIRARAEFDNAYKAFQAYYVRKYYEYVENDSLPDIRQKYNYQSAYNNLSLKK